MRGSLCIGGRNLGCIVLILLALAFVLAVLTIGVNGGLPDDWGFGVETLVRP